MTITDTMIPRNAVYVRLAGRPTANATPGQLRRGLEHEGLIRRLRGGGRIGDGAYPTVRHGWADPIVPHVPGAQLIKLLPGSPYSFAQWLSVAPAAYDDPRVAEYLAMWGIDLEAPKC